MLKAEFDRIYSEYRETARKRGIGQANSDIACRYDGWLAETFQRIQANRKVVDRLTIPLRNRR